MTHPPPPWLVDTTSAVSTLAERIAKVRAAELSSGPLRGTAELSGGPLRGTAGLSGGPLRGTAGLSSGPLRGTAGLSDGPLRGRTGPFAAEGSIAIDVEADGLFAYRPKLCTAQIAWREGGQACIAIIDALAVSMAPLGELLGAAGPTKVLHDLTFDARLLQEEGIVLGNVYDTSVAARMLGFAATGLASLLSAEFSIKLDKDFQQHDWSQRPLKPEMLRYLADDVAHLLDLSELLCERVRAADIASEVADECSYKLSSALRPPQERPAYLRVKGVRSLDPKGRAILRRLAQARETLAQAADCPPFKILRNEGLLELSRQRPTSVLEVRRLRLGRSELHTGTWIDAIGAGSADGDVPAEEREHFERPRPNRELVTKRRAGEVQLMNWRRKEAKHRGVDEQVVLPGHCVSDLIDGVMSLDQQQTLSRSSVLCLIENVPGIGKQRIDRYASQLTELWLSTTDSTATEGSGARPGP